MIGLYLTGYRGYLVLKKLYGKVPISWVCYYDDFENRISLFCREYGIQQHQSKKVLDGLDADKIFFIGWQYIVKPQDNYVVLHDSYLPRLKGFCPTVASLINGEEKIGVTAFKPTDVVDDGPVYAQEEIDINYPITIREAMTKSSTIYVNLIKKVTEQDPTPYGPYSFQESYSIWRDAQDYFIDWSRDAKYIERMINAVGYPYKGAQTYAPHLITIKAATARNMNFVDASAHYGKLFSIKDDKPIVVCGEGAIQILDYKGLRIKKLKTRLGIQQ